MRPDELELFKQVIKSGVEWLQTEQPDGAIMHHLGIYCEHVFSDVRVSLCPKVYRRKYPAFIFSTEPEYIGHHYNTFSNGQVSQIRDIVSLHADIIDEWNGCNRFSYSIAIDTTISDSLAAALNRYKAGCPDHEPHSVFCDCGWYQNGAKLLVKPDVWQKKAEAVNV